jgi:putative DNA primase/helicase
MSTETTNSTEKLSMIPQDKNNLKKLVINDIEQLANSSKAIQKSTDDILEELMKSISVVDFRLLAFPESRQYLLFQAQIAKGEELSKSQSVEFDEMKNRLLNFQPTKNHYLIICIEKLLEIAELNNQYPDLKIMAADINNPSSLDNAFSNSKIIVNCAGPFLDTAKPIS